MTTVPTNSELATQVYQVFIKASPEQIWAAITSPDQTARYFHGARISNTPERHVSRGPDGSIWGDGDVFEYDPPRKLVHEWRSLYDPELADEHASRVTWEIEPKDGGYCELTVIHDQLERAPKTAASVSGTGWMFVLSGLKTVVETGSSLAADGAADSNSDRSGSPPATHISQIGTVIVPVTDQESALNFYRDKLGFEPRLDVPFGQSGRWIEVAPPGAATTIAFVQSAAAGPSGTEVSFATTDASADHRGLRASGVDTDEELIRMGEFVPPMFTFRDPDGNRFRVVERP